MAAPLSTDPRFDALRNALYHTERRSFFDILNKLINFIVIVLGAGAVAKFTSNLGSWTGPWIELGVVVVATAQLVFDFGSKVRVHEFLQKRYNEVLSEMEQDDVDDEACQRKWSAKLITIGGDEPLPMRALDALAFNKAADAIIADPVTLLAYRLYVPWWQKRFRHYFAFHSAAYISEHSRTIARERRRAQRARRWKRRLGIARF